jgi:hypothetical protein
MVLFIGLSVGGLAFAYQAGESSATSNGTPAPVAFEQPDGPEDCAEGLFWHPVMDH